MRKLIFVLLFSFTTLATAATTANPTRLFDWAEKTYPGYFPTHAANQTLVYGLDTYIYRYYPQSGNYLGLNLRNCGIYVIGTLTDGDLLFINYFTNFTGLSDGFC